MNTSEILKKNNEFRSRTGFINENKDTSCKTVLQHTRNEEMILTKKSPEKNTISN